MSHVIFFLLMSSKQSCFSGSALNNSVSSLSPPLACFQPLFWSLCLSDLSFPFPACPPRAPKSGISYRLFCPEYVTGFKQQRVFHSVAHVAFYLVPLTKYIPEHKQPFPSPSMSDSLIGSLSGQRKARLSESFLIKDYIDIESETMWFL